MEKIIVLNGASTLVDSLQISNLIIDDVKTELLKVEFSFVLMDEREVALYKNLFEGRDFKIEIPSEDIKVKTRMYSWSSSTRQINQNAHETIFHVILKEYDEKSESPHWMNKVIIGFAEQIVQSWSRSRAISELLVEKGIITNEEYVEKIEMVYDRDFDEMKSKIAESIDSLD